MRVALLANSDWYLYNFRRSLASAIRDAGMQVLLLSPPGPYGGRLLDMGFDWSPIPMRRGSLNPIREILLVLWLAREFRRRKVDLVHGFTIKCAVYGSIASRICGVKAIVNAVAGMGYVFTSGDLLARVLRPFVRSIMSIALASPRSRLVLQNPDDVAFFSRAGIVPLKQIRLIFGSGVDCLRFCPPKAPRDTYPVRVLLPARLVLDKGIEEYVGAARRILRYRTDVKFFIAGAPDPHNPSSVPDEVIDSWSTEGSVEFLGHVEDMSELFQSVHIVVLPSYREGLPKGLIEAGACACALVTTDVPGCREVVEHERNGLLVPVRDELELANAILRLVSDAPLRERLGKAARDKVLAQFDEKIVVRRTLEVYSELVPSFRSQ